MQAREVLFVFLVLVVGVSLAWYVDEGRDALGELKRGAKGAGLRFRPTSAKSYEETTGGATVSAEGVRLVRIRTRRGTLRVESWDSPTVEVRATKRGSAKASARDAESREGLAQMRTEASRTSDTVNVSADCDVQLDASTGWSAEYVVRAPPTLNLDIVASSGDVHVALGDALPASVKVTADFGDVTVLAPSDARMTVDAVASRGRVECAYKLDGSTSAEGTPRTGTILGKINGGGTLLRIRAERGAIRIAPR